MKQKQQWSKAAGAKVVIAGGTGFLGSLLVRRLHELGAHPVVLARQVPSADQADPAHYEPWDPARNQLDENVLRDAYAVVSLAGAPIARWPWTKQYQRQLITSRINPILSLRDALRRLGKHQQPQVVLTGSAVGYYGDRGEESLDESAAPGEDFLARLCVHWEKAGRAIPGERHVQVRTGMVLGQGGVLEQVKPLYRFGLGANLGSGEHWFPTISATDHIEAMVHCLFNFDVAGPVNLVAPHPVRYRQFHEQMDELFTLPSPWRGPAPVLKLAMGQMSTALLSSIRAVPAGLEQTGFEFAHPTLADQLGAALDGANDAAAEGTGDLALDRENDPADGAEADTAPSGEPDDAPSGETAGAASGETTGETAAGSADERK